MRTIQAKALYGKPRFRFYGEPTKSRRSARLEYDKFAQSYVDKNKDEIYKAYLGNWTR